ncbi:hypothetical protein [Allosphingosinicella indica]|uniref:Uncharacterized protein n=1 Tax=Allosphingosinicella indica TaxID=941907 RepID=A0A1X7GJ68_9SPHN|nr:hypothetical protein [Allosphingosinicella indica]SMF70487.1 hypothetical protein SAMN06295910_1880 [Allosphingosinicella indica]
MARSTTVKAARPVPASIPMPDSAIRLHWAYQLFVRLPRPALDWIGVAAAAWALFVGDWLGRPMDDAARIIALGFVAALYGIRTVEKTKGVA